MSPMVEGVLDGRSCADSIMFDLAKEVRELDELGVYPHLAVVIVGDDPASHIYVNAKESACARLGIKSSKFALPESATMVEMESLINELNEDIDIDGILVQSPLPAWLDEIALTEKILPSKDVDGFHPVNLGKLVQGRVDGLLPCTPHGVMKLLEWADVELTGERAVIVGRSRIVGMPQALMLSRKGADATVTLAHSRTEDLANLCRSADILIAAVGKPEFIKPDWVKEGSVVVDVGVNRVTDENLAKGYRLTGDVHPDAANSARLISPVPGGVGPMTIAMLMTNAVLIAKNRKL